MAYFLVAFLFFAWKHLTHLTHTHWCLFLHCYQFFQLLEMRNIIFCTCLHDFGRLFPRYTIPCLLASIKLRSQSSHMPYALTLQKHPSQTGQERSWFLTLLTVWSKKPHCVPLGRLDKWLQKISLRQVEGQVKWNLIDETVQETDLVHTELCKDSWACCDSISSRIRSNMGHGTVLSQCTEKKQSTSVTSLLFTPKPTFLFTNGLCCLNACLP